MSQRIPRSRRIGAHTLVLVMLVGLLTGCAPANTSGGPSPAATTAAQQAPASLVDLPKNGDGYIDITVDQLAGALANKQFTLVNVHVPYEGDLPQTDLWIPYDEITQQASEMPDKNAPIVLYCRSGSMSTAAAKDLVKLGYTKVMELDGGMVAWEAAGRQLQFKE